MTATHDEYDQALEQFSPRALLPSTANASHALAALLTASLALGAVAVGLGNLPGGFALLLVAFPAVGWAAVSLAALRANRSLPAELLRDGVVVRAVLHTVVADARGAHLEWEFRLIRDRHAKSETQKVAAQGSTASEATGHTGSTRVGTWAKRRYFEGMQVAVLVDAAAPEHSRLFPPPSGGTQLDVFSDVAASFMNPSPASADDPNVEESPGLPDGDGASRPD